MYNTNHNQALVNVTQPSNLIPTGIGSISLCHHPLPKSQSQEVPNPFTHFLYRISIFKEKRLVPGRHSVIRESKRVEFGKY